MKIQPKLCIFAGEYKSSICKAISSTTRRTLFHGDCQISRPLVGGVNSIQRSLCSFSDGKDDFSELGSPLVQTAAATVKLLTEKCEILKRNGKFSPSENSSLFTNTISRLNKGEASPASSPKVEKNGDVTRSSANREKISSYIRIVNVPSKVKLPQLVQAVSIYGNTSSASMRTLSNGVACCDVKFEDEESSRKAISAGGIAVGMCRLPVLPLSVSEPATFKIQSISKNTDNSKIKSVCKSFGAFEGLSRNNKKLAYVVFSPKDESETQQILAKLNTTLIDGCQWYAELIPRNSKQMDGTKSDDEEYNKLKLQMTNGIHELKEETSLMRVHAEDLQRMHTAIMNIEHNLPAVNNI